MNKSNTLINMPAVHRTLLQRLSVWAAVLLLLVAASQILAACAVRSVDLTADIGQAIVLEPDQKVAIKGEPLEIRLVKIVSDSRCPKGANCIWAGEVSSQIEITYQNQTKSMILTQSGGSDVSTSTFMTYTFAFSVDPYPELNKTIKAADYRLNLTVTKEPALTGGILATFKVIEEQYSIFVTNKDTIEQIYALQRGESNAGIPIGRVLRGAVSYNKPWNWHIDSEEISMTEMTVEVSDGLPSHVENDIAYWVDNVRYFSPWGAELIDIKDYR